MSILGIDADMGYWGDVIAPTAPGLAPAPSTSLAPAAAPPTRLPSGLPVPPPASALTRFVPPECSRVRELVYGRTYSDFRLPDRIMAGTVAVIAVRVPIAITREEGIAIADRAAQVFWARVRGGETEDVALRSAAYGWEQGRKGYIPAMSSSDPARTTRGIVYVALKCAFGECSRLALAAMGTRLQAAISERLHTRETASLPLSGKAPGNTQIDVTTTAIVTVGALEDFAAALTAVFSTSINWDLRLSLTGIEAHEMAMSIGQGIASTADVIAANAIAQARAVPTNDPSAADRALAVLDENLARAIAAINNGISAASQNASTRLTAELGNLLATVRAFVVRKITTIADMDETRRAWLSCRWWTEAENQYPIMEASLNQRISAARSSEAWYASNGAMITRSIEILSAARMEISRIRSTLNLAWYEKKIGPMTPIGWGITAIGAGLAVKLWRMRSA